jgi:hypothetical protein
VREAREVEEALELLRDAGEVDSNVGPDADAGPEAKLDPCGVNDAPLLHRREAL